jgi:hypothetical protein
MPLRSSAPTHDAAWPTLATAETILAVMEFSQAEFSPALVRPAQCAVRHVGTDPSTTQTHVARQDRVSSESRRFSHAFLAPRSRSSVLPSETLGGQADRRTRGEAAMFMRVRQRGDEIHIELTGVAGRHAHILQAVSACRESTHGPFDADAPWHEISVRSQSDAMRICMRPRDGRCYEPATVYESLRQALFSAPRSAATA